MSVIGNPLLLGGSGEGGVNDLLFWNYDTTLWESGGLTSAAAANFNNAARLRSSYLPPTIKAVKLEEGWEFLVYVFTAEGTYLGIWDGAEINKAVPDAWNTDTANLWSLPQGYKFRIVVRQGEEEELTPADAENILLGYYTDEGLTMNGVPADGKATGDKINTALIPRGALTDADDLDLLTKPGIYFLDAGDGLPAHSPYSGAITRYARLLVIKSTNEAYPYHGAWQIVVTGGTNRLYFRGCTNTTGWKEWKRAATFDDLPEIDAELIHSGAAADAAVVGTHIASLEEAVTEVIDTSNFRHGYGGIDSRGYQNKTNHSRLRIANDKGKTGFFVRAGSTITVSEGYKFNCAQYDRYENTVNFHLIALRSITDPSLTFTVPQDCYIKITIGTTSDDVLWTEDEDDGRTLTLAGQAALENITLNLLGATVMEKINDLENVVSGAAADAIQPMRHTMPINARDYHALWDEMVDEGFCTRSDPTYMTNDTEHHWPLYTYKIKAHKDWMESDYSVTRYDGTEELYPRPKALIVSGVHGSERGTPNFLLDFIKRTMRGSSEYAALLVKYDWTIVPLANPWGYSHSFVHTNGTVYHGQGWYDQSGTPTWRLRENLTENGYNGGIRRVSSGHDMNRDFSDVEYQYSVAYPNNSDTRMYGRNATTGKFNTEEADYLYSVLESEDFDVVIDLHQAQGGNTCGFVSFAGTVFDAKDEQGHYINEAYRNDKYRMVVQAAAATDVAMCNKYDFAFGKQTAFPWRSIPQATFKNYAAGKKSQVGPSGAKFYIGNTEHPELAKACVPVLETSTVCTPYSNIQKSNMSGWHNEYSLEFGNTFLRNFLRRFFEELEV